MISAVTYQAFDQAGSDLAFVVIYAALSLPWYPLLVYQFTARERGARIAGGALVVVQVVAGVVFAANL